MVDNQEKLRAFILELSISSLVLGTDNVNDKINNLKLIYENDFRHFYSNIFSTITLIKNDEKYDLQMLIENIGVIFNEIQVKHNNKEIDEDFFKKAKKLYDHINLDVARIKYTETLVNKITEQNNLTNKELRKINEKAENMQRDYVTILGIFAAVIIAFVSGMTFSTSVLNNIDKVSIYRLTFVAVLIAFLLFNLINLLLDFLLKINKFNTNSSSSFIKFINKVLLAALGIDVLMWAIYWYRIYHPDSWINIFS